jgi:hypothetical protein
VSRWVVDTSPLVFLAKLDHLSILRNSAEAVLIPSTVLEEVRRYGDDATQRIDRACHSWLRVHTLGKSEVQRMAEMHLGPGESAAILLAERVQAERLMVDDLAARRLARRWGLKVVGTLGLLLAAHLRGDIPSLADEISRLQTAGFHAHPSLVRKVLEAADEA